MNVMDALVSRRSIRQFTGKLYEDQLRKIVKAAQTSPVGRGAYETLHLTVITDGALIREIDENAANLIKEHEHPLYGAPTLIVVSTGLTGTPRDNSLYSNAAIAVENMVLEAVELGVGACHIWGATAALAMNPALVAKLGIPQGFTPVCAVALGKTDDKYYAREIPEDRIAVNYL